MLAFLLTTYHAGAAQIPGPSLLDWGGEIELKFNVSSLGQSTSRSLTEWCQQPSWLFGLPNIVTLMAFVCLIAIVATVVAIIVNDGASAPATVPAANTPASRAATPVNGAMNGHTAIRNPDRVLTDKAGQSLFIDCGAGHSFLLSYKGRTYAGRHDGSWRRITVRYEGENYTYTDNIGKGSFLCTKPGAPFGNLLKMQAVEV